MHKHFGPDQKLARAQFALILYRMNGAPEAGRKIYIRRCSGWFTGTQMQSSGQAASRRCYRLRQIQDYSDLAMTSTREQMAVMMYRYAKYAECDTE